MVWYEMRDSNPRPSPCKGAALPLRQSRVKMELKVGFEPTVMFPIRITNPVHSTTMRLQR